MPVRWIAKGVLPLLGLTALAAHLVAAPAAPEEKAARAQTALTWRDTNGRVYSLTDTAKAKATVFLFVSTQCPIANTYTPRILALAKAYQTKGVQFFLVDSNADDSAEAVKKYAAARAFPFPVVRDEGTSLADYLNAQVTPQAIILDAQGAIRYTGRIDDSRDPEKVSHADVQEALDALLAGKAVTRARTLPFGCAIFRDKAAPVTAKTSASSVTFTKDVAPILNANCVMCHRTGEVAPFSLETYAQARPWARAIKDYTARHLMPPWKPLPGWGEFHDERALTKTQIETLAHWADANAPQGDPKDLPTAPVYTPPTEWTLGKPDMILQPERPYHLAAEGRDVYRNFVLPVDFKEDRWVSGMEFKPENRAIVHHIVTYIDTTGASAKMDGKETEPGYTVPGIGIGVAGAMWGDVWVPGNPARRLPPGVAVKVPKGAKIVMQVHYHKTGKPETDRSRMALYFARDKVEKQMQTWTMGDVLFRLKPGSDHEVVRGEMVLPVDVHLRSMFPHMHMLGKEMKVTATLPDGTVQKLIYIKDWDFNWQATYYYKTPIALPKGTKLQVVAVYDNSAKNPHQTSQPPKLVTFGEQTTDEMCFAIFGFTFDKEFLNIPSMQGSAALLAIPTRVRAADSR